MGSVEKQQHKVARSVEVVALGDGVVGDDTVAEVPKVVKEYPMPGAIQTHEMVFIQEANTLFLTQQTNSTLVALRLDTSSPTLRPLSCNSFTVGDSWAGLHGLTLSKAYPSCFWATLQFKSLLLRFQVDSTTSDLKLQQTITLPPSVFGPHVVIESGRDLWTTCKDSSHVVRLNHTNPTTDFTIYPCSRRPIFVAVHPINGDAYASLDLSNKIWRFNKSEGSTTEIDIPPSIGNTPVGLVAGPDGNVWFTLVGNASGGSGTFARISADGDFTWFTLTSSIGSTAGLIHLAFDWSATFDKKALTIWLLASSLVAGKNGFDGVLATVVDTVQATITTQQSVLFPTQLSASHRVLPVGSDKGLFVTLLSVSTLAHVLGAAVMNPTSKNFVRRGETSDFYAIFGQGIALNNYTFSDASPHTSSLDFPRKRRVVSN